MILCYGHSDKPTERKIQLESRCWFFFLWETKKINFFCILVVSWIQVQLVLQSLNFFKSMKVFLCFLFSFFHIHRVYGNTLLPPAEGGLTMGFEQFSCALLQREAEFLIADSRKDRPPHTGHLELWDPTSAPAAGWSPADGEERWTSVLHICFLWMLNCNVALIFILGDPNLSQTFYIKSH